VDSLRVQRLDVHVFTALVAKPLPSPLSGLTSSLVVLAPQVLDVEDKPGYVAAYAVFEDGSRMELSTAVGLRLASVNSLVVAVPATGNVANDNTRVLARGAGAGPLVRAFWRVQCETPTSRPDTGFDDLGEGFGTVAVTIPEPFAAVVTVESTRVARDGDAARLAGVPATTAIHVELLFRTTDGQVVRRDMTADARTTYDTAGTAGLLSACQDGSATCLATAASGQVAALASGSGSGVQVVFVRFAHARVVGNVSVEVVESASIDVQVRPFPAFPGSDGFAVATLRRYANPNTAAPAVRQQAQVFLSMALTNGQRVDVSQAAGASFRLANPVTNATETQVLTLSASRVLAVRSGADDLLRSQDRLVQVQALLGGFGANPAVVRVTDTAAERATIRRLLDMQVAGAPRVGAAFVVERLQGSTAQLSLGASFSDGTQRPDLVGADGTALLPGALLFSSLFSAAVAVDSGGRLRLQANHDTTVRVAAAVLGNEVVSTEVEVVCNLLPGVGDVDLGNAGGFPLTDQQKDAEFVVPVRINTGGVVLGAIDVEIRYDSSRLEIPRRGNGFKVDTGRNWPGGVFEAVVDPPGLLKLGGATDANTAASGAGLEIALITFRAVETSSTPVQLIGTVVTFAANDLQGTVIGAAAPRAFVAGQVSLRIVGGGRRRRSDGAADAPLAAGPGAAAAVQEAAAQRARRNAKQCTTAPCSSCAARRETGDANGDCVFDIRDVSYTQVFLAERQFGFLRPQGRLLNSSLIPAQLVAMDADLNGVISVADALFLARVNFNLLRFAGGLQAIPVQDRNSNGLLSVNLTLLGKGDVQDPADRTMVFVDLTLGDASLQGQFDASQVVLGARVTSPTKPAALSGMLVQAQRLGPFYNSFREESPPPSCFLRREAGNTCAAGQRGTRYYFDPALGSCQPFDFFGCNGNLNNFFTVSDCTDFCVAAFRHSVALNTSLLADGIGVSLLLVSFSSGGVVDVGRDLFLSGAPGSGGEFAYGVRIDYSLSLQAFVGAPVQQVGVLASFGYSPVVQVNNRLTSAQAVNLFDPVFTTELRVVVNESHPLAVPLIALQAQDADAVQIGTISFAIDGVGSETDEVFEMAPFRLHGPTGVLTLMEALDYESVRSYSVNVVALDNSPPRSRRTVATLEVVVTDVNDNAPVFTNELYGGRISVDVPAGTPILRVRADDADSNTAEGGNNALVAYSLSGDLSFTIDSGGLIRTSRQQVRRLSSSVELVVTAVDQGVPPRSATARVVVAVINEDFLITISTRPNFEEFEALRDPLSGDHPCLVVLEQLLGAELVVNDISHNPSDPSELTDITFYAVDTGTSEVLATSAVEDVLRSVSDFQQCTLRGFGSDQTLRTRIQHFREPSCEGPLTNLANVPTGFSGTCVNDPSGRSGRVYCTAANPLINVSVFETPNCGGVGQRRNNVRNNSCIDLGLLEGIFQDASYIASCVPVLDAIESSGADSGPSVAVLAGISVAGLVILVLVLLLVLRYQQQRRQINNARKMVQAMHGDVTFGTPEPMRKGYETTLFSGGEIDPITGELIKYKETTVIVEDADRATPAMPAVMSTIRNNPLFGRGAAGFSPEAFDSGSDEDGESMLSAGAMDELLDDLSDFETFEQEMFAAGRGAPPAGELPGAFKNPPYLMGGAVELDDLSDFDELDAVDAVNEPYLDMESESSSGEDSDFGADNAAEGSPATAAGDGAALPGILKSSAASSASGLGGIKAGGGSRVSFEDEQPVEAPAMRRSSPTGRRRRSGVTSDLSDLGDARVVVPQVQFEDVQSHLTIRQDDPAEEERQSDSSVDEFESPSEDSDEDTTGSHFKAVQTLWSAREHHRK
jgi:hypothetical protein